MSATLPLTGDGDINQNSATPANGLYKLTNNSTGHGYLLTIEGSNATGTNKNGGNIVLLPGTATGSGVPGSTQILKRMRVNSSGSPATPNSTLHLDGSFAGKVTAVTSDYTASEDFVILVDSSGGDTTITLPPASPVSGRIYFIKEVGATFTSVTIAVDDPGSETIEGETSLVFKGNYSYQIISIGSHKWKVIGRYP